MSAGVGRMLIMSIGIVFFLTVLSVYISTVAISKIDVSQKKLTTQSIPALVDVGDLSSAAINLVKQSN